MLLVCFASDIIRQKRQGQRIGQFRVGGLCFFHSTKEHQDGTHDHLEEELVAQKGVMTEYRTSRSRFSTELQEQFTLSS